MVQIPKPPPPVGELPKSEPVPEGTYHIRCDKAGYAEGKTGKKTPYAATQWVIFGPAEAEEFHGRKLFDNLMLDGEGMFHLQNCLTAAGFDDDFQLTDTDTLLGIELAAVVVTKAGGKGADGKEYGPRSEISRFMPIE